MPDRKPNMGGHDGHDGGGDGKVDNPRLAKLSEERSRLDSKAFPETYKVLNAEIEKEQSGVDKTKFLNIHSPVPTKVEFRVRIPIDEFPQANFVGKLVGPQGTTINALTEQTGCRLAIFGRGSIKDRKKEDELRKQGGKYAHLNTDLHLFIEVGGGPAVVCYQKLAHALSIIQPLIHEACLEDRSGDERGAGGMGLSRGRGGMMAGRGGRGMAGGRGMGAGPGRGMPAGRGSLLGRGGGMTAGLGGGRGGAMGAQRGGGMMGRGMDGGGRGGMGMRGGLSDARGGRGGRGGGLAGAPGAGGRLAGAPGVNFGGGMPGMGGAGRGDDGGPSMLSFGASGPTRGRGGAGPVPLMRGMGGGRGGPSRGAPGGAGAWAAHPPARPQAAPEQYQTSAMGGGQEGYYDYESAEGTAAGYDGSYSGYPAVTDTSYGDQSGYSAANESSEMAGYEYGEQQAEESTAPAYETSYGGGGWGADGSDTAGQGGGGAGGYKAPPPTRGGLGNYRTRPY